MTASPSTPGTPDVPRRSSILPGTRCSARPILKRAHHAAPSSVSTRGEFVRRRDEADADLLLQTRERLGLGVDPDQPGHEQDHQQVARAPTSLIAPLHDLGPVARLRPRLHDRRRVGRRVVAVMRFHALLRLHHPLQPATQLLIERSTESHRLSRPDSARLIARSPRSPRRSRVGHATDPPRRVTRPQVLVRDLVRLRQHGNCTPAAMIFFRTTTPMSCGGLFGQKIESSNSCEMSASSRRPPSMKSRRPVWRLDRHDRPELALAQQFRRRRDRAITSSTSFCDCTTPNSDLAAGNSPMRMSAPQFGREDHDQRDRRETQELAVQRASRGKVSSRVATRTSTVASTTRMIRARARRPRPAHERPDEVHHRPDDQQLERDLPERVALHATPELVQPLDDGHWSPDPRGTAQSNIARRASCCAEYIG